MSAASMETKMSSINEGSCERLVDPSGESTELQHRINWAGTFWLASGVPALVLASAGSITATVYKPSWIVLAVWIRLGLIQVFVGVQRSAEVPRTRRIVGGTAAGASRRGLYEGKPLNQFAVEPLADYRLASLVHSLT